MIQLFYCCPTCPPGSVLDEDVDGWWCPTGEHHVSFGEVPDE